MLIYKIREDGVFDGEIEYSQSTVIPKGFTFTAPPNIPSGHYAIMYATGWQLIEGDKPVYPPTTGFIPNYAQLEKIKEEAIARLKNTDWTATVDINNPQYSNPYLMNQDEFLSYRSQVRQIALNPLIDAIFPPVPEEVWSS
jgi:hypothetical protein